MSVVGVISRGGRPDLVPNGILATLNFPVLLLVGGEDGEVLDLNRWAASRMPKAHIQVVPHATHLFEEPGAMREVEVQTLAFLKKLQEPMGREGE
jgi:putative phosphoribosyl transferase